MYRRVLFIGSKGSGLKALMEINKIAPDKLVGCVTVDDSDDDRSVLSDFKNFCHENGIKLDILIGKCDLKESITKYKPDLCFVMGWYYIISETLLNQVKGGFIGIHNSLLPAHRGFAPVVWAMIAGETYTGFSVFSFEKGMDTGDIWYQGHVKIEENDYISNVLEKLDFEISLFFRNKFEDIITGKLKPQKQGNVGISYGVKRTAKDGVIEWNRNSKDIYDFIRAQSHPYPGAYTTYKAQKIIIWEANIFPHPIYGRPGQIGLIDLTNNKVVIVCGENTGICLTQIDINNKIINVTDIVKSLNVSMI